MEIYASSTAADQAACPPGSDIVSSPDPSVVLMGAMSVKMQRLRHMRAAMMHSAQRRVRFWIEQAGWKKDGPQAARPLAGTGQRRPTRPAQATERKLLATGALADHLATAQRLASECGDGRIDLRFGHKQVGVRAV